MESGSKDSIDDKGIPTRLYFKKVRGGRIKIEASIHLGGSWLSYESLVRDVIEGRRPEIWFEFVKDSEQFRAKQKTAKP